MYKCGNKYQDRPCDAGQKGKAVGSTGASESAAAGSGDAQCAQLGRDALKIVWSREGGATQEQLESEAKGGRAFVRDVYRRRGSASQVQAAVEADCAAQKRNPHAVALEAFASRLREIQLEMSGGAGEATPPAADPKVAERLRGHQAAESDRERKKARCAHLTSTMDALAAQQRTESDASMKEGLNERRSNLQAQMNSAGC